MKLRIEFLLLILLGIVSEVTRSYQYSFDYPLPEDYRISILMDPCRYLAFNCCINVFGTCSHVL